MAETACRDPFRSASRDGDGAALSLPAALVMAADPGADVLAGGAAFVWGFLQIYITQNAGCPRRRHLHRRGPAPVFALRFIEVLRIDGAEGTCPFMIQWGIRGRGCVVSQDLGVRLGQEPMSARVDLTQWVGFLGLTVGVGVSYYLAARLSL